jgi:hypothetical protein
VNSAETVLCEVLDVAVVPLEAGDDLHRLLDRRRDVVVDHLGRRAGVRADDRDLRELHVGRQLLLERRQGDPAEHGDDDGDEGDQRAVAQAEDGQKMHEAPVVRGRRERRRRR